MPLSLTFNTPGRWGINYQEQNQLMHPNWATTLDSLVINDGGQVQCRGAFDLVSTDGAATAILRQFVYVNSAGTEVVISTTATKIISGITDLDDASTDITSATTPTNGYWQFQNFNGKVVGWQAGHTPIVKTSGDFADIVAATGTLPDGDCVCAAFGRLWAVDDDGQTVRYCALLDETKWDAADGGGSIDMRNVWPKGMDRVVAIAAFGANLVIFGRRCIVIYTDGSGSTLGLDPTQMYVVDTIDGTGCASRDTVCVVGEGDLLFMSELGVQSLSRVIQSKDNPIDTISWQIADFLTFYIASSIASATDTRSWTGGYIPRTRQYILTSSGFVVLVFHMGGKTQDDRGRPLVPIAAWSTGVMLNQQGFITTRSGITYTTGSATHEIYKYDTAASLDEGSTAIAVQYRSGWLKFDDAEFDHLNKMLKMVQITLLNPAGIDSRTHLRYATDYSTTTQTLIPVYSYDDDRVIILYDPSGDVEGQYFRLGFEDASFGLKVLTQLQAQFKLGRTAFIHKKFNDVAASEAFVAATPPVITTLSPDTAVEGAAAFTLTITGTGFTVDSVAQWEGEDRATTYVSATELTVAILAGDVDTVGSFDVTVTNAVGGVSNTATFEVANSRFVAVSQDGASRVMYSDDGITWTSASASAVVAWLDVCFGAGLYVAVGTNACMTSPDGITWTNRTIPTGGWIAVAYSEDLGLFVAAGTDGTSIIATSPDGITWTQRTIPNVGNLACAIWVPWLDLFIVGSNVSSTSCSSTSPDGITWTSRTTLTDGHSDMADSGTRIVASTAANNTVQYSDNGTTWTKTAALFGHTSIAYGDGLFVTVSTSLGASSSDGINWTERTVPALTWRDVVYSSALELFVAVGSDLSVGQRVMTSPDGVTWTQRTSAADNFWTAVCISE